MRITDNMLVSLLLYNLNKSRERLTRYQTQLSTGKKLIRPSDDPSGIFCSLKYRSTLKDVDRYQTDIENSMDWLSATDSALQKVSDDLAETRELAMRGCSGTLGESELNALAYRVDQLIQNVLDLANTEIEGKYIFGGTETLTPPYSSTSAVTNEQFTAAYDQPVFLDGTNLAEGSVVVTNVGGGGAFIEGTDYTIDYVKGSITVLSGGSMLDGTTYEIDYQTKWAQAVEQNPNGISGQIYRKIGEGLTIPLNLTGEEVFADEIQTFDVLLALRNDLIRGNAQGISQALVDLDTALDQTLRATATEGSRFKRLELAQERLKQRALQTVDNLSETEDTDIAETVVNLRMEENALEAALRTGARLVQLTLTDFL